VSSDRDGDHLAVERQEEDLRKLCADRDWTVIEPVYSDNSISATRGAERKGYDRLLKDIARGAVDAVAVWDIDRLSRVPGEIETFVATMDKAGITQLAFVGGSINVGTGDGLLVARIKAAVAAEEAAKMGKRIRRSKRQEFTANLGHL
jgi:site-specific DNA recombinase